LTAVATAAARDDGPEFRRRCARRT
jgi:hypothetical protein